MPDNSAFHAVGDSLWVEKRAGAMLNYTFDYVKELAPDEQLTGSSWTAAPGIELSQFSYDGSTASVVIAGGAGGNWYLVTNTAHSDKGLTYQHVFRVYVKDSANFGAGVTSCFPSLEAAVMSLRRDRLVMVAKNYLPKVGLDDDYLLEMLLAAEATIQHQLRVFLTPREMLPFGAPPEEIQALKDAGNVVEIEPGYDYDPRLFQGNTWGLIELRQRPLLKMHSITFSYPAPDDRLFTIPDVWIRPDSKYGRVNLVPVQDAIALPLNAFILSALGGGRTVPLMLQVRYRAGLENAARDWPDILNLIKKEAVLSIVEQALVPSSASVSGDGLSQSVSFQAEQYRKTIDATVKRLRIALHGVMAMVV